MRPSACLPLVAAAVAGCGREEAPVRLPISAGAPFVERGGAPTGFAELARREVRVFPEGDDLWIEVTIPRDAWSYRPLLDYCRTYVGVSSPSSQGSTPTVQLTGGGRSFRQLTVTTLNARQSAPPGTFEYSRGWLALRLAAGEEPPEETEFRVFVRRYRHRDERLRFDGQRFTGPALVLWSGERITATLDLPPRSTLRFATIAERLVPEEWSDDPTVRFHVDLDGVRVFEHELTGIGRGAIDWHAVPLPAEGRPGARLVFGVDGLPANAGFLAPTLGPAEVGEAGARPWHERRPDLVVFLADTFRADNVELCGGEGWTPFLDDFARGSVAFPRAYATSTFTLPSHASLLGGLWPRDMGLSGILHAVPPEVVTLAEVLRAAGYRTGAVTDSGLVSQVFRLDQGFEVFDELQGPLDETLARARAFLDADDGRPVLLFVQTYRTHTPYCANEEAPTHGPPEDTEDGYHARSEELRSAVREGRPFDPELLAEAERAYRSAAGALDRGFAAFHADLERRGLLASGYLVFTSDHGEAFAEHDVLYHSGPVWNELLHVPLLVHGPGLAPRTVPFAASLTDLPPTLAALAGVEPAPGWVGTSLLSLDRERPLFASECDPRDRSTWALIEGAHKVMGCESDAGLELVGAYDLARDPGEERDLLSRAAWPRDLVARHAALLRREGGRGPAGPDAELDAARLDSLRALGYVEGE